MNEDDIELIDIAHALSRKCRFGGHVRCEHYSVAQHSVHVSELVPPQLALKALLHDASEAYLPDYPAPMKKAALLRTVSGEIRTFNEVEDEVLTAIFSRFGLESGIPDIIHIADKIMLATEVRDLLPTHPIWSEQIKNPPANMYIEPLLPEKANRAFLQRFRELATE